MIRSLQRALLVLVVLSAWCLVAALIISYLFGNIFGLFTVSVHSQA